MFGFSKKEKEKMPTAKISFLHPLLGKVEFWNHLGWQTTKVYQFCIFKKAYGFYLYINDNPFLEFNEEEKRAVKKFFNSTDILFSFNETQEAAIKKFLDSIDELQELAEKELMSFFKGVDSTELAEKIEIQSVTITKKGDICLPIESSFDDSILEFIPEDALFTDSFGMVIYPEVKVFPNIDDYYDFKLRE